jgi:hypothetical protein
MATRLSTVGNGETPGFINHEIHEGPDAAKPQPKEETAKDAKSAKNLFFLRLSRFSRLKKGSFRVLEIIAVCVDSVR